MSLKELFNNLDSSTMSSGSLNKLADEIESSEYLETYYKLRDKLRTHTDYSKPKNFAKFGSAEKYYTDAIERIYRTYPYDGSLKEKIQWELSSSGIDLYVFDKEYPRTNGFANFVIAPASTGAEGTYFYPSSGDNEYILTKGGPNTSKRKKNKDINDSSGDFSDGYANVYDTSKNRESNLKIGGTDGNTVEFWLKKDAYAAPNQEYFEFIFDAHVTGTTEGDDSFGRFAVALVTTGTIGNSSDQAFFVGYGSGSTILNKYLGASTLTTASIADGEWHHYAVTAKTSGSDTVLDLFVDGKHNDRYTESGDTIGYVSGTTVATVGALAAPYTIASNDYGLRGWSKFSGSLDEVRFWKTNRNAQQIGRQYIEPVGGGTNTDDANTDLGIYFKFNEGITLTASVDATVLDYSGRISNGLWEGYSSTSSRSTGSAIILSGKASSEFEDPILYSFHPEVQDLIGKKTNIGKEHDYQNPNSVYNSIPGWITETDNEKTEPPLKNLTQIISNYFDTVSNQIENLTKLKEISYSSGSLSNFDKPFFFNNRMLQGMGFPYIPDLFSDASFFEFFRNRSDTKLFQEKLYDIKNTIYRNLYNNLVYINKSKGTEKAFRNMLRCFGVDDEIYKIRHYATDAVYEFRDNYKAIVENKNYVDLTLTASAGATVYQYQTDSNTTSYITASATTTGLEASGFGFTIESQAIFPVIGTEGEYNSMMRSADRTKSYRIQDFVTDKEASIFGIRSVDINAAENDLTVPANDRTGFVVKIVRDNDFDKRGYFKLEPTDGTSYLPTITSSYFEDIFDNTKWNLAVTVKPSKDGQFDLVSGSSGSLNYDVTLYGVNSVLDDVRNSFAVSSSISKAYGQTVMTTPKRVFVGALRDDVTGSLVTRSNAYITDCRFWLTALTFDDVKRHNFDFENFGIGNPYQNTYLFQSSGSHVRVPKIETLALNWNFTNLSSSNTSGQFDVIDLSSGSATDNRFGTLSDVLNRQHSARGENFLTSSTRTFAKKSIYNARTQLPEFINSHDMVTIRDSDDVTFTRSTRPTSYLMTFEKSMYQTVSEEMLKFFSTVADFGSMVGDPVNEFRTEYKSLSKLRQLFFENVSNTPKVEKYIDYYRWLDSGLNIMLANLIPASAVTLDAENLIRPIIEEYIFNRNKYDHKFPTMEFRQTDPTGHILGIREGLYNYRTGHAPIPTTQDESCNWWQKRAERDVSGSGNTSVDSNRQTILDVENNLNNASVINLSGAAGSYEGSTYAIRNFARPYKYKVELTPVLKGGTNFTRNKNLDLINPLLRQFLTEKSGLDIRNPESASFVCTDDNALDLKKTVNTSVDFLEVDGEPEDSYLSSSVGSYAAPFNVVSGTTGGGNFEFSSIVNVHNDSYGYDKEIPAQGPFTERHVGGKQYRHQNINTGSDNILDRAEGYRVSSSFRQFTVFDPAHDDALTFNADLPRATYYRDETAKRPVNIRNIQSSTGSQALGNYYKDYEIVTTTGRRENNRFLVDAGGTLLTASNVVYYFSGAYEYELPNRTLTGSNKFIFVNRFSAPGDPSTMSEGFLDVYSGEYSVYNAMPWRNLDVRLPLQELLTNHCLKFGYYSDWFREESYEQAGKTYPGGSGSISEEGYDSTGSYQKNHRNTRSQLKYSTDENGADGIVNNTASHDNYYVRHQIPQTDAQYAWITSSLISGYTGSALYGFEKRNFSNASFASTDLTFISSSDFVSYRDGSSQTFGATKAYADGASKAYQPTDFAGMNTNIYDPITASSNTLGYPTDLSFLNYINWGAPDGTTNGTMDTDTAEGGFIKLWDLGDEQLSPTLNSLLLHRQGPWGGANWKLYRKDAHPITRKLRSQNRISFLTQSRLPADARGRVKLGRGITSSIEPAVVSKHKPITFDLDIQTSTGGGGETRVVFEQSYLNNFVKFSQKVGNGLDLNIHPSIEFLTNYPERKLAYNTLATLITDESISQETNPINKVNNITVQESIHPREKFAYLADTRKRTAFRNNFWRDDRQTRSDEGNKTDSTHFLPYVPNINLQTAASIWPLDGRLGFTSSSFVLDNQSTPRDTTTVSLATNGKGQDGILQNDYAQFTGPYSFVDSDGITREFGPLAPLYNRRIIEPSILGGSLKYYIVGDTKWEAGISSSFASRNAQNINPFYDTYNDYVDEAMRAGKGFGILPEFRISEHMDYYVNQKGGNFLAVNTASLSLTGAIFNSEAEDGFIINYLHSDFMKAFKIVGKDLKSENKATSLEFECDAILKFLPYNDLYPALHTIKLAKMFYEDYNEYFKDWRSLAGKIGVSNDRGALMISRPLYQCLFAPGVLYNSIKSGMAVDYPILTSPMKISGAAGQVAENTFMKDIPRIGSSDLDEHNPFGFRVPFEAILRPEEELARVTIYDQEPHPVAQFDLTCSLLGSARSTYKLAMNNFLAATIDFFKPAGRLATIASLPDDDGDFGNFVENEEYVMKVSISNGKASSVKQIKDFSRSPFGDRASLTSASYIVNPPNLAMYQRTASIDVYGSSFGPPVYSDDYLMRDVMLNITNSGNTKRHSSASYSSHTPPYYDGYAEVELKFVPSRTDKFTIDEIVPLISSSFGRVCTAGQIKSGGSFVTGNYTDSQMEISATLNYLQVAKQYGVKFDAFGNPTEVDTSRQSSQMIIQPKWETPILNFKDSLYSLPLIGSGAVAQGMWHQFGTLPTASSEGIFIQVQDSDSTSAKSLADAMGFKKTPVRLGEVAQQKEIFEAIVAIPHVLGDPTREGANFTRFAIDRKTIDIAEKIIETGGINSGIEAFVKATGAKHMPSQDIINMVEKMKKFILPPKMDFITNKTIAPFAIFIFEFSATLSQQDLANIWQNLPPDLGTSMQKSRASLPINIFRPSPENGTSMLESLPENIQWSVFKAKQRGAFNYYAKTADSRDDKRFKFNFASGRAGAEITSIPDYSFNWPFDYFSLVELAKIDCKVNFGKAIPIKSFPKFVPPPVTPTFSRKTLTPGTEIDNRSTVTLNRETTLPANRLETPPLSPRAGKTQELSAPSMGRVNLPISPETGEQLPLSINLSDTLAIIAAADTNKDKKR